MSVAALTPSFVSIQLKIGELYIETPFVASGFSSPPEFVVSPSFPSGLFLTPGGQIFGIANIGSSPTRYTVTATSGSQTASAVLELGVAQLLPGIHDLRVIPDAAATYQVFTAVGFISSPVFSSSNTSIVALDPETGEITVISQGMVEVSAYSDDVSVTSFLLVQFVDGVSVTYNGNGNTSGTAPGVQIAPKGTVVAVQAPGHLLKSAREFDGWNTHPDGSGTAYLPGSFVTLLADVALYAQWKVSPCALDARIVAGVSKGCTCKDH